MKSISNTKQSKLLCHFLRILKRLVLRLLILCSLARCWPIDEFLCSATLLKKLIKLLPKENLFCSRRRSYSNFVCLFCFNCLLIHETNYLFPGAFIVWQNSNDFLFQEERDDETGVFTYKYISATTNQAKYLGVSSNCIDRNLYVNCTKKTDRRCLFKKKR